MLKFEVVEIECTESPTITLRIPKLSRLEIGTLRERRVRSLQAGISSLVKLYNDYPNESESLFYASNWLISLSVKLRAAIEKVVKGE
jgi:hypothetical protein